jgi:hypothetical protein
MSFPRQLLPQFLFVLLGCLFAFPSLSMAQTAPPSCDSQNQPVPGDIAAISAALGICHQMSSVVHPSTTSEITADSLNPSGGTNEGTNDLSFARSRLAETSREIARANLVATLYTADATKRAMKVEDALKLSGIIIGGIGAGVGGSLHLVNNPSVGHAGTVLGIASGVTGAGINLAAFFIAKPPQGKDAPSHMLAQDVQGYVYATQGTSMDLEKFRNNPSSLSRLLIQMSDEVDKAQALLNSKTNTQSK